MLRLRFGGGALSASVEKIFCDRAQSVNFEVKKAIIPELTKISFSQTNKKNLSIKADAFSLLLQRNTKNAMLFSENLFCI